MLHAHVCSCYPPPKSTIICNTKVCIRDYPPPNRSQALLTFIITLPARPCSFLAGNSQQLLSSPLEAHHHHHHPNPNPLHINSRTNTYSPPKTASVEYHLNVGAYSYFKRTLPTSTLHNHLYTLPFPRQTTST